MSFDNHVYDYTEDHPEDFAVDSNTWQFNVFLGFISLISILIIVMFGYFGYELITNGGNMC